MHLNGAEAHWAKFLSAMPRDKRANTIVLDHFVEDLVLRNNDLLLVDRCIKTCAEIEN